MIRRVEEVARVAAIVDLVEAADPGRRDREAEEHKEKRLAAKAVQELADSGSRQPVVRVPSLPKGKYISLEEDEIGLLDIHV